MIPPNTSVDISGSCHGTSEIVFTAFFHHLYNIFLLKESWTTPPFRTPLDQKYTYIQTLLLNNDSNLCGETNESLNNLLSTIQTCLKTYPYNSWLELRDQLINPWTKKVNSIAFDTGYRLLMLEQEFENSDQILTYLECSLDQAVLPPKLVVKRGGPLKKYICELLLKKIDTQTIFLKTGVVPLYTNWVKELDFFLFRLSRDGI
jgi:hypothetical protein